LTRPSALVESKSMKQSPADETKSQAVMRDDKNKLDQAAHGVGDDTSVTISMQEAFEGATEIGTREGQSDQVLLLHRSYRKQVCTSWFFVSRNT
jgi:hypothetical protein